MFSSLTADGIAATGWSWSHYVPYYEDLAARELTAGTVAQWLADWTRVAELIDEAYSRLHLATTQDTADEQARQRYHSFLENVYPHAEAADQRLKEKLLASGLQPEGLQTSLRRLRAEADLFREANLPLLTEERKLSTQYDAIVGAQTVMWEGVETTLAQLLPVYERSERPVRQQAWRLEMARRLQDREAISALWRQFLSVRKKLAANAGFADYRSYRWRQMLRFDYTPEDCLRFQQTILDVVVPAATRLYEKDRRRLGLDVLRPWDLRGPHGNYTVVDPPGTPGLQPFVGHDFVATGLAIFRRVDPALGAYFETMIREDLLDLLNRKGKGPGAFCTAFHASKRAFVFMNGVGVHDDVQTLLHECGHAFHDFESAGLPYLQQRDIGYEFAEVASIGMELLAAPYLDAAEGGFYSAADTARARASHLKSLIFFWPYMAVVDAFQHWVYTHHDEAADPAACDAQWDALWMRFMPGVDWSGFEEERRTGWQRKLHIHKVPFYYVEYGLAQTGALQVWRNALADQAGAVASYRRALALGATEPLPKLFEAAGARFAFDPETIGALVALIEQTLARLEPD